VELTGICTIFIPLLSSHAWALRDGEGSDRGKGAGNSPAPDPRCSGGHPLALSKGGSKSGGGEASFKADVEVEGEEGAIEVKVKVRGAPASSYDIMLHEGAKSTKIGELTVNSNGRCEVKLAVEI
jgi:hypothetical protein